MKRILIKHLWMLLEHKFPKLRIQEGGNFSSEFKGALWVENNSYMPDGMEACSFYDPYRLYEKGIHKELARFLKEKGFFAEPHQDGMLFIWPQKDDV